MGCTVCGCEMTGPLMFGEYTCHCGWIVWKQEESTESEENN